MYQDQDVITIIISAIIGLYVLFTLANIAARLKKLRDISFYNFLKENNIHECNGCNKYYSKDEIECPHCKSKNPKDWPFAKKLQKS